MLVLFKILGLGLVFISCTFFGFWKSFFIRKRAEKLERISRSVKELAARIRAERTELKKVIPLCFEEEIVSMKDGKPSLNNNFLESRDIKLLKEFFETIGMRDIDSEYERICLFGELIEKEGQAAFQKAKSLCRLYNSLGILFGLIFCIFFL